MQFARVQEQSLAVVHKSGMVECKPSPSMSAMSHDKDVLSLLIR